MEDEITFEVVEETEPMLALKGPAHNALVHDPFAWKDSENDAEIVK